MRTKTIEHKLATLVGVAFTLEECKQLLDSQPVEGLFQVRPQSVWQEKRLRMWCSTPKVQQHGDPIAMAKGADYAISLLPRQVRTFGANAMATNYKLPVEGLDKPLRFLFFCREFCKLDDVLHVQLLALNHPVKLGG